MNHHFTIFNLIISAPFAVAFYNYTLEVLHATHKFEGVTEWIVTKIMGIGAASISFIALLFIWIR